MSIVPQTIHTNFQLCIKRISILKNDDINLQWTSISNPIKVVTNDTTAVLRRSLLSNIITICLVTNIEDLLFHNGQKQGSISDKKIAHFVLFN